MKEAFEKIKERLSIESDKWNDIWSNSSKGDDICDYADGKNDAFDEALSIVSEVEAEYGNGWIPCNEKDHPYDGQRVLACINTRIATHEIIITDYNGGIYWFDGTISAWMPLPEPYKPTTD